MKIEFDTRNLDGLHDKIKEMRTALGCALEWLQTLQPYYVNEPTTTDRDREKLQQVIDFVEALARD